MKKLQAPATKSAFTPTEPARCSHCGREMTAGRCTNVRCPGMSWQGWQGRNTNVVELRPFVERRESKADFVGALYTREIRVVDGCECQGVSVSTVACGDSRKEVERQIATVAKQRAQQYSSRGYKVLVAKALAA